MQSPNCVSCMSSSDSIYPTIPPPPPPLNLIPDPYVLTRGTAAPAEWPGVVGESVDFRCQALLTASRRPDSGLLLPDNPSSLLQIPPDSIRSIRNVSMRFHPIQYECGDQWFTEIDNKMMKENDSIAPFPSKSSGTVLSVFISITLYEGIHVCLSGQASQARFC